VTRNLNRTFVLPEFRFRIECSMKQSYLQPTFALIFERISKCWRRMNLEFRLESYVRMLSSLPEIIRNNCGINITFKSHGACIRYMIRVIRAHTGDILFTGAINRPASLGERSTDGLDKHQACAARVYSVHKSTTKRSRVRHKLSCSWRTCDSLFNARMERR